MRAYERLLRYAAYPTASHEGQGKTPSTDCQRELAAVLVEELKTLGCADAAVDENGYVFGTLPGNRPDSTRVLGLIAHMDVSDAVPCEPLRARVIPDYDGEAIVLNDEQQIVEDAMPAFRGKTLIVTDGTTLLGADDKAGIAEIMTALERFQADPSLPHGTLKIGFTPDEEIGEGADHFDVKRFGADVAFTVDGGTAGEVQYQTFNATACTVTVRGISTHPGDAKGKMINAAEIAAEYDRLLPQDERPQCTDGTDGFYHLTDIRGDAEHAELRYILRDHNEDILKRRETRCRDTADYLNRRYGADTVTVSLRESYRNMETVIREHPELVEAACEATREVGLEPILTPVRGGTDGSRLSFMGLPCPNLGTGGYNYHGRFEFAVAEEMDAVTEILLQLAARLS